MSEQCNFEFRLEPNQDDLAYLVSDMNIRDASITASSERNTTHAAKRVRINRYDDDESAWAPAAIDHAPWVQFDMEQDVTVWGIVMKPRCDDPHTDQRVTLVKVARSDYGVQWQDTSNIISADYSVYEISTSWLDEATTARYWRIEVVTWHAELFMKADLIGRPKGKLLFLIMTISVLYQGT